MKRQQHVQETILNNAIKLKQLARTNIDKTQDILTSIIQAARHEYDLLQQVNRFRSFEMPTPALSIRFVHYRKPFKQSYE